jgi:glycosyltransferase involved in cell wall biosynthesis
VNASSKAEGVIAAPALRILHVFRAPVGGLYRHVCDLAQEQGHAGHQVGIVCDATTGGAHAEATLARLAASLSLGVRRVEMSRSLSHHDVTATSAIARHVAEVMPHVVHGHGAKGGAYARLLPRSAQRIALYTPHGGALHYSWSNPSGAVFLALERFLRRRSDGMLFESEFGAAAYTAKIGAPRCPWRVVPNGLGDADFAPLPEQEPSYDAVFVGELRMLKGVAELIHAVSRLGRPDFRLAIAGTGPDEARFHGLVAEKGLDAQVTFLGHRPAREVFAFGRMVVVPSLAESFPYIVLEAIASGRPLIATRVGGIPEIFGPLSHLLVPPGDSAALAKAMAAVFEGPQIAAQSTADLKNRARSLYAVARMAREITLFYGEVARLRGKSSGLLKRPETAPV